MACEKHTKHVVIYAFTHIPTRRNANDEYPLVRDGPMSCERK